MFTVITIMFSGILVGYLLRNLPVFGQINKTISGTIFALLLFLGIAVGLNDTIVSNLQLLGVQALVLAVFSSMGSVLAAWGLHHLFFKKKKMS